MNDSMRTEEVIDSYRAKDGTPYVQVWRPALSGLLQLVWVKAEEPPKGSTP